jgi:hypothetical protein
MLTIAKVSTITDDDGISIKFLNSDIKADNVISVDDLSTQIAEVKPNGGTPLGRSLRDKVVNVAINDMENNRLQKPLSVIVITDGEPNINDLKVRDVIKEGRRQSTQTPYGKRAIAYQFVQIGNDPKATKFLNGLDNDKEIGDSIDCTGSFEAEEKQVKDSGNELTVIFWLLKLLTGHINPSYDKLDEEKGPTVTKSSTSQPITQTPASLPTTKSPASLPTTKSSASLPITQPSASLPIAQATEYLPIVEATVFSFDEQSAESTEWRS